MDLLAYWRWDNYVADLDAGAGLHFNSRQPRLHSAIEVGERLWLVTGRPSAHGRTYPLVACLTVAAKTINAPDYKYGRYRLWGDPARSRYFSADGHDAGALLRRLRFDSDLRLAAENIGQALQTLRGLTAGDSGLLEAWARDLVEEPRATRLADEGLLEGALARGDEAVRELVAARHLGASEATRHRLERSVRRNRELVRDLRGLYKGRCQLCAFDPQTVYGVGVCEGHHIVYLSRGGPDELGNLVLLCPNHHEVIHAAGAVFDFRDLHYIFPRGRREPLALNEHLRAA